MSRLLFRCLYTVSLLILGTALHGASLRAIIVADVRDASIGVSVQTDLHAMTDQLLRITQLTGLDLDLHVLSEGRFTAERVWRELKSLKVDSDDTLFFYYSGHGYRDHGKETIWPALFLSRTQGCLDLSSIAALLGTKGARFNLIMADCCNSFVNNAPWYKARLPRDDVAEARHYQRLFCEEEGTLLVSSSSVGEYAYGTDEVGGLFTAEWLWQLQDWSNNQSWQDIMDSVVREFLNGNEYSQTPQYALYN